MDKLIIEKELGNYRSLLRSGIFAGKKIYAGPVNEYSRYYIHLLKKDGFEISMVFDRDPRKKGKKLCGVEIAPLDELDVNDNSLFCIASQYYDEIHDSIAALGISESNIIKCVDFIYNDYKNMKKSLSNIVHEIKYGDYLAKEIINKGDADKYIIFPYNSIGDIYILGLYKNYIESIYGNYELLLFGKSSCDVARLCGLRYRQLEEYDVKCLIRIYLAGCYNDRFSVLHFNYASTSIVDGISYYNDVKLIDFYSGIFFQGHKPNLEMGRKYVAIEDENEIAEKAVILAPFAKSVCDIPSTFWEELAGRLIEKGYKVYSNCFGQYEIPVYGTIPLSLDFTDLAAFLNRGNVFISLRSGLCDVMGLTKGRKIVLYSNDIEYNLFSMEYLYTDSICEMIFSRERDFCDDAIERMESFAR